MMTAAVHTVIAHGPFIHTRVRVGGGVGFVSLARSVHESGGWGFLRSTERRRVFVLLRSSNIRHLSPESMTTPPFGVFLPKGAKYKTAPMHVN